MYPYASDISDIAGGPDGSFSWSGELDDADDSHQILSPTLSSSDHNQFFHHDPAMSWALNVDDNESIFARPRRLSPCVQMFVADHEPAIAESMPDDEGLVCTDSSERRQAS